MDYQGDTGGGGNYGGGGFGGGGGFNASQGGFSGSQGGGGGGGDSGRARRSYDEQTLVPVTARMILSTQSASNADGTGSLALPDGRELYRVKLVGAVRSFEEASTNVLFMVEDGTGLVEVKQWLDANDNLAVVEQRHECMKDNIYLKVIGQIKDYDGRKTLVADTVRKLHTSNEIAYHMLEVVYSAENYKRRESIGGLPSMMSSTTGGGVGFGAGVSGGGGAPIGGQASGSGNPLRDAVLNFIKVEGGM
jgi:replication factor A2